MMYVIILQLKNTSSLEDGQNGSQMKIKEMILFLSSAKKIVLLTITLKELLFVTTKPKEEMYKFHQVWLCTS